MDAPKHSAQRFVSTGRTSAFPVQTEEDESQQNGVDLVSLFVCLVIVCRNQSKPFKLVLYSITILYTNGIVFSSDRKI